MTANPHQGVRIERSGVLRLTSAGRIAIRLSVDNDGTHVGEGNLVLTYDAAAELHTELGLLLAESVDPNTPDERSLK
ncbi:hypothetical protein OIU91_28285 [Streptomyces sp. NBC_01456]|uniref:hypothetical protein n=1 Tax=unclassified Streptomyces TaxID=2593676 RepID=UPI002E3496C1|nr:MULTISPECIES: hypothetical protein [unclassified Streptomyces]